MSDSGASERTSRSAGLSAMPGDSVSFCFTIFFPHHILLGHGVRYLRAPSCHTPSVSHPYECDEASLLLSVALRPHPVFHLDTKHFPCCVCHTVVAGHCCAVPASGTVWMSTHGVWPCWDQFRACSRSKVPPSGRVSLLKRATSRLCRFKTAWLVFTGSAENALTRGLPPCLTVENSQQLRPPELASPSRSLF